jgi:hypothetical protein
MDLVTALDVVRYHDVHKVTITDPPPDCIPYCCCLLTKGQRDARMLRRKCKLLCAVLGFLANKSTDQLGREAFVALEQGLVCNRIVAKCKQGTDPVAAQWPQQQAREGSSSTLGRWTAEEVAWIKTTVKEVGAMTAACLVLRQTVVKFPADRNLRAILEDVLALYLDF